MHETQSVLPTPSVYFMVRTTLWTHFALYLFTLRLFYGHKYVVLDSFNITKSLFMPSITTELRVNMRMI
jgi:hypothetical protein